MLGRYLTLFLITGNVLRRIKHENLPERAGQISVRNNELAIPSWSDGTVILFKIERKDE